MPDPILPTLLLLLVAPAPVLVAPAPAGEDGVVLAQLTIRQRIIIRVPRELPGRVGRMPVVPAPPPPLRMSEKKGPKCIPVERLAGSAVARKDSVDLMMSDGTQLRAKLHDDCPALDFYAGFYLRALPDRMLCADRDVIRARSGRACPIVSFKRLEPKR